MSGTINPIENAADWQVFFVGDTHSPGVIAQDGMQGWKRGSEWDKKKGKGTRGCTLTFTQAPPAEGSIKCLLWLPEHFVQWDIFRPILKCNPGKTPTQGLDIYHPALAELDINSVVVKDIGPCVHHGLGLYSITVWFIEFFPPPPVSVVSTPTTAKATTDPEIPGLPPDPESIVNQAIIARLNQVAAQP